MADNLTISFTLLAIEAQRIGVNINAVWAACPSSNDKGDKDLRLLAPILLGAYEAKKRENHNHQRKISLILEIVLVLMSICAIGMVYYLNQPHLYLVFCAGMLMVLMLEITRPRGYK